MGFGGEVRSVSRLEARITEAKSLGFKTVIAPAANVKRLKPSPKGIKTIGISNVGEAFHHLF